MVVPPSPLCCQLVDRVIAALGGRGDLAVLLLVRAHVVGQRVAEGSRIAGFTVVTIAQDRVVLQGDSGALTLLLEPLREDEEQPATSEE